MNQKTSLVIIMCISLAGLLFSGFLSYNEIWGSGCNNTFIRCGNTFRLFHLPACVYGFFMYTTVFIVACLGLSNKKTHR